MKSPSLSLRLTLFISSILFLACFITTSISYFKLKESLEQVFDSQQLLFAKRLAALRTNNMINHMRFATDLDIDNEALNMLNYDDDALAFAIFNLEGEMIMDDGAEGKGFYLRGGFFPDHRNQAIVHEQEEWRILWLLSNDNRSIIAVGQKLDYQQNILSDLVYKQLIPWLITFIIITLFVAFLIRRSFLSIKILVNKMAKRRPDEDSPINIDGIPREISPFIVALNKLFLRISSMISHERQFISDAAHELRTPLAALRVQTEVAQLSNDDPITQERALNNLLLGIDRTSRLIDQLLTLSRLDALDIQNELQKIYWQEIITSVVEELTCLAETKNITITIDEQSKEERIIAQPVLLSILIRNLINNAIRYIPDNGNIIITIKPNKIIFSDNGLGVDDTILARLGERFYRPAGQKEKGSGLGLSIVKKIAQLHKIRVDFSNRTEGGFSVTLSYSL